MDNKTKLSDILIIFLMFLIINVIDIALIIVFIKILSWSFGFPFKWKFVVGGFAIFIVLRIIVNNVKKE